MSSNSKSKSQQTESFIEPFSNSEKKKPAPLELNPKTAPEPIVSEESLTQPVQTFSKSFLQPLAKEEPSSQALSLSAQAHDDTVRPMHDEPEPVLVSQDDYPQADMTNALTYGMNDADNDVVLLVGGGHLSKEVARLAHYLGFVVDVVDTREEYLKEDRFPNARKVVHCSHYEQICDEYTIGPNHALVILTHTYETDFLVLSHVVHSAARYIGVAGSMRKKQSLFNELRKKGVPATELACVSCPIGVAIGASSPEEMAVAIVAELVAARAGCLLAHLSRRSS